MMFLTKSKTRLVPKTKGDHLRPERISRHATASSPIMHAQIYRLQKRLLPINRNSQNRYHRRVE
jgi:hypothetical protein